jgi:hypothetical protein
MLCDNNSSWAEFSHSWQFKQQKKLIERGRREEKVPIMGGSNQAISLLLAPASPAPSFEDKKRT